MEALAQNHPDDREAKIFYALSLLASADPLDKTYKNQLAAGAILGKSCLPRSQPIPGSRTTSFTPTTIRISPRVPSPRR